MNPFADFMADNAELIPNEKFVATTRFKNKKTGQPIEWEIRAISSDENEEIQRASMTAVTVGRGQSRREIDGLKYVYKLVAASVVYPDLNNAELQDSYKVKTPEALLKKMLYPSEFDALANKVMDMTGIQDLGELVKEAKN